MAPATSPAPRATTRSASTSANSRGRWAGAWQRPHASWQRRHEYDRGAALPRRPGRLVRADRLATALARLAGPPRTPANLAGAGSHRGAAAAAFHGAAGPAPGAAVGRHPQPVLFLPRRGRGMERAHREVAGARGDRPD